VRLAILFCVLIVCASPARAQPPVLQPPAPVPQAPSTLEPDRPDVTNGTHIVDVGLLQIEFGGIFNRSGARVHDFGTPTTFRVGLTDWLEARMGTDGFLSSTDGTGTQSGIGNVQIGAKLRLWASPGGIPVLSVLPAINLPAASSDKGLGSGQSDFTVAFLTGTDFLTRGHVDVNYGIGLIGAGPGLRRFTQHLASVSASVEGPGSLAPYVEGFWFSRQDPGGTPVAAIDAGAIYAITPRFAIDGGLQWGVSRAAPSFSAFGGVSVIVGNILGGHGVHARQKQLERRNMAAARKSGK